MEKYCGTLMLDYPPQNHRKNTDNNGQRQNSLTIDCTTSLENSCIRSQDNFIFTSFIEPIKVNPQAPLISSSSSSSSSPSTIDIEEDNETGLQKKASSGKTPRPPNAFILYRKAKQTEVSARYKKISNSDISKILAKEWKNEGEDVIMHWRRIADMKKMEHERTYPNYVFRPRKNSSSTINKKKNEKKTRKSKKIGESPSPHITSTSSSSPSPSPSSSSSSLSSSSSSPYYDVVDNDGLNIFSSSENIGGDVDDDYIVQQINNNGDIIVNNNNNISPITTPLPSLSSTPSDIFNLSLNINVYNIIDGNNNNNNSDGNYQEDYDVGNDNNSNFPSYQIPSPGLVIVNDNYYQNNYGITSMMPHNNNIVSLDNDLEIDNIPDNSSSSSYFAGNWQ